jgi:hypothetical protein
MHNRVRPDVAVLSDELDAASPTTVIARNWLYALQSRRSPDGVIQAYILSSPSANSTSNNSSTDFNPVPLSRHAHPIQAARTLIRGPSFSTRHRSGPLRGRIHRCRVCVIFRVRRFAHEGACGDQHE